MLNVNAMAIMPLIQFALQMSSQKKQSKYANRSPGGARW
jgi:hypothetical protein